MLGIEINADREFKQLMNCWRTELYNVTRKLEINWNSKMDMS